VVIESSTTTYADQTNADAAEADFTAKVFTPTVPVNSPPAATTHNVDRPKLNLDTMDVTEDNPAFMADNIQDNGMTASPVAESDKSDDKPEVNDDKDEITSEADSDLAEDDEPQFVPQAQTGHVYPRYEIAQAMYHLTKVEELWADDKSGVSLELEELFTDVVRFFDATNPSFHAWRTFELSRPKTPMEGLDLTPHPTPLHIAAANGLVELSRRLLDRQEARLPLPTTNAQELEMESAIENANDESLQDTAPDSPVPSHDKVGPQTDINAQMANGTTPLWWASIVPDIKRRYIICKLLLEKGAIPGIEALRQADGDLAAMEPPFHALLYNKATDLQTVKLFLDHNASVTEIDPYGYNVMHDFAWEGSDPAILDLLMEAGADINVRDEGGETPLHKLLSSQGGNMPLALLERFLFHKADITVEDKDNQQALYEVAIGGSAEALKLILAHVPPPDINHKDVDGWTALHIAAVTQW
jgi:ankyrin repeat protein